MINTFSKLSHPLSQMLAAYSLADEFQAIVDELGEDQTISTWDDVHVTSILDALAKTGMRLEYAGKNGSKIEDDDDDVDHSFFRYTYKSHEDSSFASIMYKCAFDFIDELSGLVNEDIEDQWMLDALGCGRLVVIPDNENAASAAYSMILLKNGEETRLRATKTDDRDIVDIEALRGD
jgi:hypothetical protein